MHNVGSPRVNLNFCVLCLNLYIPKIVPIPPPNAVITKIVFSGILHFPLLCLLLIYKHYCKSY